MGFASKGVGRTDTAPSAIAHLECATAQLLPHTQSTAGGDHFFATSHARPEPIAVHLVSFLRPELV